MASLFHGSKPRVTQASNTPVSSVGTAKRCTVRSGNWRSISSTKPSASSGSTPSIGVAVYARPGRR